MSPDSRTPADILRVIRDPARLAEVRRTGLLDTPPEEVFDRLTRLAARVLDVPVSFLSMVDEGRDFYKSQCGFGEPLASTREMPGTTFCHYTIPTDVPLVINDTREDPVYRQVPTVESLGVIAYAGIPLITSAGQPIGSFCAIDFEPRRWSRGDIEILTELAASAMREIELRMEVKERLQAEAELRVQLRLSALVGAVGMAVTGGGSLQEVLQRCAEAVVRHLDAGLARIWTLDEQSQTLELHASAGRFTYLDAEHRRIALDQQGIARIAAERKPYVSNDLPNDPRVSDAERARREGVVSFAGYPLIVDDRLLGVLAIFAGQPLAERDVQALRSISDRIALAAERHRAEQERVHLLEESERRSREIERITESRARLVRGFSHDLKNPLGAADGHAALLADGILGALSERQQHSVQRIRASIRSALGLINDLVEMARAEAGQVEVQPAPTDVREVVIEIAGEYRAQAETQGLTLHTELPDEFPTIECDPSRVRQILGNLVSNAIKYNRPQGHITVCVAQRARDGDAPDVPWIAVEVSDTGMGIPDEKRHLLFREFSRLEPGAGHGAGLGLAISQKIAQALSGEITLQSRVGEGSTFTLWLPAAPRA